VKLLNLQKSLIIIIKCFEMWHKSRGFIDSYKVLQFPLKISHFFNSLLKFFHDLTVYPSIRIIFLIITNYWVFSIQINLNDKKQINIRESFWTFSFYSLLITRVNHLCYWSDFLKLNLKLNISMINKYNFHLHIEVGSLL
jgi:hypothetical protein